MIFVSLKTIFFGLFCLYSLGLVIFLINDRSFSMPLHHRELFTEDHSTQIEPKTEVKSEKTSSYKFTDPAKAYQILSQLEVVDDSNPSSMYQPNRVIKKPHMNLKIDDTYCDKRRAYFVQFPESVFEEMNYVSDLSLKTLVRNKMLIQVGNDVQPHIGAHMPDTETAIYDIKPEVNNFYTRMALYFERRVGRHFSCVSQVSNHMPGKQALDLKDNLAEAVIQYAKRFDDRPHCFNFNKFFPKTYLMYQKDSCLDFFKVFNSPEYKTLKAEKEIVFMRKVGRDVHMGAGVDPVNEKIEAEIRKLYANGTKCGEIEKKYLLQYFIHNPLLLYGRKFDFRMYMMVASSNPLIAYYHDGFLRVSLMQYDTASTDKRTLLTNMALNYEIYNNARDGIPFQGMGEQELMETQQWLFDRFGKYLLDNKVVEDPNWLDNYLRPELKKAMVHLLRFGLISPYEHSSVYQLYGVDFMLDANMNLWFIEANSAPGLNRFADHLNRFLVKMLADQVEIVMGLLRSRMKRVINYVNEMMVDGSVIEGENGEIIIKGLEGSRMKFNKLNENYFEEEFLPSPTNGFAKIIDGNFKGADRYLGFIDKECL